jgi:hypothetical protein
MRKYSRPDDSEQLTAEISILAKVGCIDLPPRYRPERLQQFLHNDT